MTPLQLLCELQRRGVRLTVNGDRLRYRGPAGAITAELLSLMAQHKPVLMTLLRAREAAPGARLAVKAYPCAKCGVPFFPEPATICYWCRHGLRPEVQPCG